MVGQLLAHDPAVYRSLALSSDADSCWISTPMLTHGSRCRRTGRQYYNAVVPLPLSLANIATRLEVGWYRQTDAIEHDARLLAVNAGLFHGRGSELAADAAGTDACMPHDAWGSSACAFCLAEVRMHALACLGVPCQARFLSPGTCAPLTWAPLLTALHC